MRTVFCILWSREWTRWFRPATVQITPIRKTRFYNHPYVSRIVLWCLNRINYKYTAVFIVCLFVLFLASQQETPQIQNVETTKSKIPTSPQFGGELAEHIQYVRSFTRKFCVERFQNFFFSTVNSDVCRVPSGSRGIPLKISDKLKFFI